jgi:hypothetical protein
LANGADQVTLINVKYTEVTAASGASGGWLVIVVKITDDGPSP